MSKATGTYGIGPTLFKLAAPHIAEHVTYICHHSINVSVFPNKLKEAKNDLPLYVHNVNTDLYADDTTLYAIQNSVEYIENNLQIALESLKTWFKCNGMLLNSSKTKIMLVTTNQKRQRLDKEILDLKFNEESLNKISNDKILGVLVDQNLTWSDHIRHLSKKITSSIWLLSKVMKFLSQEHCILFHKSYIQPHIGFCNIVWGSSS